MFINKNDLASRVLSRPRSSSFDVAAGLLSFGIGALVIFGWLYQHTSIVEFPRGLAVMQFNTSVCFLFSGLGLLAWVYEVWPLRILASIPILLISSLTILEYAFQRPLGVDTFFITPFLTSTSAFPGRMNTSGALASWLIGLALLIAPSTKHKNLGSAIGMFGTIAASLGALALLSFCIGLQTAMVELVRANPMSLHTSVTYIFVGLAIGTRGFSFVEDKDIHVAWVTPTLITLGTYGFALWLTTSHPATAIYDDGSPKLIGSVRILGIVLSSTISLLIYFIHAAKRKGRTLKRSFKELKDTETTLQAIFESAPDCMLFSDPDSVVIAASSQLEKLFGYQKSEIIGKPGLFLVPGRYRGTYNDWRKQFVKDPSSCPTRFEIHGLRKDGTEFPIEINLSPVRVGEQLYIASAIRDVSERQRTDRLLREQEARFAAATKISALGSMAAGIGHEINNPLAAIKAISEDLYDRLEVEEVPKDEILEKLRKIERTTSRISKIIKGLRDFSREEDGDPLRPVLFYEILEETLSLCRKRMESQNVAIVVDRIPPSLRIACRPVQISQVLLNLFNNAFDATYRAQEKRIRLSVDEDGAEVHIKISDTGEGVPDEIRERILDPFFSTKDPGKNSGLGLSISRGIIEGHGGRLWLDTSEKNTTFVISLPEAPLKASN